MFPLNSPDFLRDEYNARIDAALQHQRHASRATRAPGVAVRLRAQLRRVIDRLRGVQPRRPLDHTA